MRFVSRAAVVGFACMSTLGSLVVACSTESSMDDAGEGDAALSTGQTCGVAAENEQLTVSCPSGTISKVSFASYGRPRGQCGAFRTTSCHAPTSQSVVEAACLGKASCTLSASNAVFGDPCEGMRKRLYVEVACADASGDGGTASPAPSGGTDGGAPPPSGSGVAPTPTAVLPTPTNIANGSTVSLQCGTTYQGTLNLAGKSNVTVRTEGTCGKASITPGRAVTGWSAYQGSIYSAPIGFTPVQVAIDGVLAEPAHWPNKPQLWATGGGGSIPSSDLIGATLVTRDNLWTVRTQTLTTSSVTTSAPFYVEGKLWMLDAPGEWTVASGRIYMWAPDGKSPEGRIWVTPSSEGIAVNNASGLVSDLSSLGINANNSSGVTIDGVVVFSATDGISGAYSTNMHVRNTEVINSSRDGIYASSSAGLVLDGNIITRSVRNGIGGWYSTDGAIVTNNTVTTSGTVGMPKPAQAGIMFGNTSKTSLVDKNRVIDSASNGITVSVGSVVSNNVVDRACVILADCGGIYTNGRTAGFVPLNMRIEGNTISTVLLDGAKGIYLDDGASYVSVTGNKISNTASGLFIHDGSNNTVTGNVFSSNIVSHAAMALTSSKNVFTGNTFNSTRNELTFHLEGSNLQSFGTFDYNTYTSTNVSRFAVAPTAISYTSWKAYMGQDAHSTMNGAP